MPPITSSKVIVEETMETPFEKELWNSKFNCLKLKKKNWFSPNCTESTLESLENRSEKKSPSLSFRDNR